MIIKGDSEIVRYLDKGYHILENRFYTNYENKCEWGLNITKDISIIYAFDFEFCRRALRLWALDNGMVQEAWLMAYNKHKLDISFSPDFRNLYNLNSAGDVISHLIDEIVDEIDGEILRHYRGRLDDFEEFFNLLKCLGYKRSKAEFPAFTYTPKQYLISMTYTEILEERKKNIFWREWVKQRGEE